MSARNFAAQGWVTEAWGTRALVYAGQGTRDHLRVAIQSLSGDVARSTVYTHTGWREINGANVYLHAGGAISPEAPDAPLRSVEVDVPDALSRFRLPEPPEGDDLRDAVRASRAILDVAPIEVTAPIHAAVWRAALGVADFSLFVVGPTGAGKSELAALAQQHYGEEMDRANLPGSWSSTANALEGAAFAAKDALFVVDDFAPRGAQSEVARHHREADRLLRAQGNRSGRARMRQDGSLRPVKPPRGLILSTGEDVPQGQSIRARALILEVAPNSIDWARLTVTQENATSGEFAAAMAGFLRWAAPQLETLRRELKDSVAAWRSRPLEHRRTPDLLGGLAGAHGIFRRFAVEAGALSQEEADALGERIDDALARVGASQAEHQRAEDPVARFIALLASALVSGDAHDGAGHRRSRSPSLAGRHKEIARCNKEVTDAELDSCLDSDHGWADREYECGDSPRRRRRRRQPLRPV